MKTTKRLTALLIALLVLAANVSVAMALEETPSSSIYTSITGDPNYTIKETLKLEKSNTIVPNVTYTLSFADTVPKTQNGGAVNPKAYSGTPTVKQGTVEFTKDSTVHGSGGNFQRYVEGNFILDFSGVTFYEPGVYRYDLKKEYTVTYSEGGTTGLPDVTNNRETDYVLVVVQSNDETATLQQATFIHNNSSDTVNGVPIGKEYLDRIRSKDSHLQFSKTVKGNMGSKSRYFEFTIQLEGPDALSGQKFEIEGVFNPTTAITTENDTEHNNLGAAGLNVTQETNQDTQETDYYITLDEHGDYTGKVWLRHGQSIVIANLPAGMNYTITETVPEGYTQTLADDSDPTSGRILNTAEENAQIEVDFVNTKQVEPPTGINLQTAVPVLGILLAGLLLAVVFCGKRRESR